MFYSNGFRLNLDSEVTEELSVLLSKHYSFLLDRYEFEDEHYQQDVGAKMNLGLPPDFVSIPVEPVILAKAHEESSILPGFGADASEVFSNGWGDLPFSVELASFIIKKIESHERAEFSNDSVFAGTPERFYGDNAYFYNSLPREVVVAPSSNAKEPYAMLEDESLAKVDAPVVDETFKTMVIITDPLHFHQWHLFEGDYHINVQSVWDDYTGQGIIVGLIDDGVEYTHPDLVANYRDDLDFDSQTATGDGAPRKSSDNHGTTTAGVVAADENNGEGLVGVAFDADITSFRLDFGGLITDFHIAHLFNLQVNVDVSNNSWGATAFFSDNLQTGFIFSGIAIENAVVNGRGGLGTNIVFAAGNGRAGGDDVNYHNFQNSPYTIAVAATDRDGNYADFSTPGAALLLSAPGVEIATTDRVGFEGFVTTDYVSINGTSFSAPIVSGVIALMLEANPNLGYRDVQEILAYSSTLTGIGTTDWQYNGADNWNGGGLHFSHDYGFGLVDAHDAVRLAETWESQSTFANLEHIHAGTSVVGVSIPDNSQQGISDTILVDDNILIDSVEVMLNIDHTRIGDLKVVLTSPEGTESILVDRPGVAQGSRSGSSMDDLHFTLTSNASWGEMSQGDWTLTVYDLARRDFGTFQDWSISFNGDYVDDGDLYIYTDEFGGGILSDSGGADTINAAAVTSDITLYLDGSVSSTIAGNSLDIQSGTFIETVYLGDGDDWIMGDITNNNLYGGRGENTVAYLGNIDEYTISILDTTTVSVIGANDGNDILVDYTWFVFGQDTYLFDGYSLDLDVLTDPINQVPVAMDDSVMTDYDTEIVINVLGNDSDPDGHSLIVSGISASASNGIAVINPDYTITYTPNLNYSGIDSFFYEISDENGGFDTAEVTITVQEAPASDPVAGETITGTRGSEILIGTEGDDEISGLGGNDEIYGLGGDDKISGGRGDDILIGGEGADLLIGAKKSSDTFVYEAFEDKGDIIQRFHKGEDSLDFGDLMIDIGYEGNDPVSDGYVSMELNGANFEVRVDANGDVSTTSELLVTIEDANFSSLTLNVDYVV